jgi:methionyl-tRNA formyltransferase
MIIIASSKKWFINKINKNEINSKFEIISEKKDLNIENLKTIDPKYIFFPHWNWKVPSNIYENFKCILFHIAPLPEGRGGSPIQNLILRKHSNAPINAIQMVGEMDAGPVYLSRNLNLDGKLSEIFERATPLIISMINEILENEPTPKEQKGTPTYFQRRTHIDNELPIENEDLNYIYDFIRMLDDDEYPKPFLDIGVYRLFFDSAEIKNGELSSNIKITKKLN